MSACKHRELRCILSLYAVELVAGNNSAWNQRHFVIEYASAPAVGFTEQKIESELGYAA